MRGSERNQLCPCGSGKKVKKCVGTQLHRPSPAEMDAMHAEALDWNHYVDGPKRAETRFTASQAFAIAHLLASGV